MEKARVSGYTLVALLAVGLLGITYALADTETFSTAASLGNAVPVMSSFNCTNDSGKADEVSAAYPVDEDVTMYFNAILTDGNNDDVYFVVCKAAGFTGGNCTNAADWICNSSTTSPGAAQCSYTADSISGGDAVTSWTASAYLYDGTDSNAVNSTTTYTNHAPTVGGSVAIDEATVYADGTMTVNIGSATKEDGDIGDTTTYYYKFTDDDDTTVLQDWSTTSTYDCSSDSGDVGAGYCTKADTIYVDVRAQDNHGLYGDGTEETYVETTKGITNTDPTIENLLIEEQDSGASANPTESTTTAVNVTVLVFDYDRTNDATELSSGSGWANCTNSHAADESFSVENKNTTADYLKYESLLMNYNATGGVKTVTTYIYDKTDADSDNDATETFTYNTIYSISLNDTSISLGSFVSGTNENLGTDCQNINNTGNGEVDVNITGAHLANGGDQWNIGNFSVDDDNVADSDAGDNANMTISTSTQQFSPNAGSLAVDGDHPVWYFVDAPLGLPAASYTSSSDWQWISEENS